MPFFFINTGCIRVFLKKDYIILGVLLFIQEFL